MDQEAGVEQSGDPQQGSAPAPAFVGDQRQGSEDQHRERGWFRVVAEGREPAEGVIEAKMLGGDGDRS